jgi:hypothetical protein
MYLACYLISADLAHHRTLAAAESIIPNLMVGSFLMYRSVTVIGTRAPHTPQRGNREGKEYCQFLGPVTLLGLLFLSFFILPRRE